MAQYAVVKADVLNRKNDKGEVSTVKDKNGCEAIILTPLAGAIPSKRTLAGTIAQRNQMFEGDVFMVQIDELPVDPVNGRQFGWQNLGSLKGVELIKTIKELGDPSIYDATK